MKYQSNLRDCVKSLKELGYRRDARRYYVESHVRTEIKGFYESAILLISTFIGLPILITGMGELIRQKIGDSSLLQAGIALSSLGLGSLGSYYSGYQERTFSHTGALRRFKEQLANIEQDMIDVRRGIFPLGKGLEDTVIG